MDLCNERLTHDVAELIRTLGWKVRVRERLPHAMVCLAEPGIG
jgi:hypothetical protein